MKLGTKLVTGILGGGEAAVFTPLSLAPVMWVKADAITGLNDGDAVTTWLDQSGNGNSPTQGTAANKPIYKTNILNGLPVVRGDGSNDFLAKAFTLVQPYTVFLVFKLLTEGDGLVICDGATINTAKLFEVTASTDRFRIYAGVGVDVIHPAVGSYAIATYRVDGASSRFSLAQTVGLGNSGANNPNGVTLFANGNGFGGFASNSDIAEYAAFSGAMTDANMNLMSAYLGTKYNLSYPVF